MRRGHTRLVRVIVMGALALGAVVPLAGPASAIDPTQAAAPLVGVSEANQLVLFGVGTPGAVTTRAVTGLQTGEQLLGVDVRPLTGELYGLGSTSRLYRINLTTGVATAVGSGPFTPALAGTSFAFDFNPTVDRIRVVSDTDQNLRLHPDTGVVAAVDTNLNHADATNPAVGAVAYANSVGGASATTLYAIDSAKDALVTQDPPNAGVLNVVGTLGVDVTAVGGFDIGIDANLANVAMAALQPVGAGSSSLYRINLTTGAATSLGVIGASGSPVVLRSLSIPTLPAERIAALTGDGRLAVASVLGGGAATSVPITGLAPGETLVGLDVRPATGALFAVSNASRLYTLTLDGRAVAVSSTPFAPPIPAGADVGFDFNPAVDRVRLVTSTGLNLRLNPNNAAVAAVDGALAYAAGDVNAAVAPAVGAVAYTNSVGNAATTTLYGIDGGLDVLATQNPPNAGTLNTIGSIGVDVGTNGGFDISGATGRAYAAFAVGANTFTTVYSVSLSTGAATPIGATLAGTAFTDITVLERPGYVLAAADGGVFALGNTTFRGSAASVSMNGSVVGVARAAGDSGYWFASTDGGVFNYGTGAAFFGSAGALPLNAPVVGMTATPSGLGYWLVASDGGIFAYGDARFAGSLGALRLNQPIVGMASTTTGRGYFLVAADGGVFAFGDAVFAGSLAATPGLSVAGLAVAPLSGGYYVVTADGRVTAFGGAPEVGSLSVTPSRPIVGIAVT